MDTLPSEIIPVQISVAEAKNKYVDRVAETTSIEALSEDEVANFISFLNSKKERELAGKRGNQGLAKGATYKAATAKLYLGVVSQFYKFLVAENIRAVNLPRIQMLIKMRGSKSYPMK